MTGGFAIELPPPASVAGPVGGVAFGLMVGVCVSPVPTPWSTASVGSGCAGPASPCIPVPLPVKSGIGVVAGVVAGGVYAVGVLDVPCGAVGAFAPTICAPATLLPVLASLAAVGVYAVGAEEEGGEDAPEAAVLCGLTASYGVGVA